LPQGHLQTLEFSICSQGIFTRPSEGDVTDGDLTRGYYIAGTGTIAADGSVGPIGGAAEKAVAAERDGAQIFLVPKDNVDEAARWVHSMRIVPVERFDDVVRFLCRLDPLPNATSADPPPVC
jgi:PDZ domain-containing protein